MAPPAWGESWETSDWEEQTPEIFQLQKHKCSAEADDHLENIMFTDKVRILFSCDKAWECFNAEKPRCVAINCEGTKKVFLLSLYMLSLYMLSLYMLSLYTYPDSCHISKTP